MAPSKEPKPSNTNHRASEILQLTALAVAAALSFLAGRASSPARVFESSPATSGPPAASTAAGPAAQEFRDSADLDDSRPVAVEQ